MKKVYEIEVSTGLIYDVSSGMRMITNYSVPMDKEAYFDQVGMLCFKAKITEVPIMGSYYIEHNI